MRRINVLLAAALLAFSTVPVAVAQDSPSREAIEEIVRDYILANPEVLVDAMAVLRQREEQAEARQAQQAIQSNYDAIARSDDDPFAGNPDGDVVVVEFFDYRCPYCKRVIDPLMKAVEDDGNVRLVFKEYPILGPESVAAARAALAAKRQDKYMDFHLALMKTEGRLNEDNLIRIAESVGLDIDQLRDDMESPEIEETIASNYELSDSLGIRGTPAFIIGRELIPGAISIDEMKRRIADARSKS